MRDTVIGLDIGTGSVKAVATDADGKVIGEASSPPLITSAPTPGASEQDPAQLLASVDDAVTRAMRFAPDCRVAAIAAAAQSGSLIAIDTKGVPARVVTWMDTRSAAVVGRWRPAERKLIRELSGWNASPGLGLSTIAWLRKSEPLTFAAAARFASVDDLVTHHLTDEWSTNPSNASGMQLMDVVTRQWSERLCEFVGITADRLSPIVATGSQIGVVSERAAATLGLAPTATVVAGGHDQACAALALGVVAPGTVFLSAGTAWVLTTTTTQCDVASLPNGISLSPHFLDKQWSASRHIGALGAAIVWAIGELGVSAGDLDTMLHSHSPAPDDPFFLPALDDPHRVAWGRFTEGSTAAATVAARAWAVLESAAFEVRHELELLASLFVTTETLVVVGRAASPLVCRLIASACDICVVRRDEMSWPALGAAQIAASTLGWSAPDSDPNRREQVEPHPSLRDALALRYLEYRRLIEGA